MLRRRREFTPAVRRETVSAETGAGKPRNEGDNLDANPIRSISVGFMAVGMIPVSNLL
jgi:hypothetical protein